VVCWQAQENLSTVLEGLITVFHPSVRIFLKKGSTNVHAASRRTCDKAFYISATEWVCIVCGVCGASKTSRYGTYIHTYDYRVYIHTSWARWIQKRDKQEREPPLYYLSPTSSIPPCLIFLHTIQSYDFEDTNMKVEVIVVKKRSTFRS